MKKVIAYTVCFADNPSSDEFVFKLGALFHGSGLKDADSPITGQLKDSLRQLMQFNILPFETDEILKQSPVVKASCEKVRDLFSKDTLTYRGVIDAFFEVLENAEAFLRNSTPKTKEYHNNTVTNICQHFPTTCIIPIFRQGGIFSFDLLWKPILDALDQPIQDSLRIVWPLGVSSVKSMADGLESWPLSMAIHDRIHLQLLISDLNGLSEKPMIDRGKTVRGIKTCLAESKGDESVCLSMLLCYGLHEQLPEFFDLLQPWSDPGPVREFCEAAIKFASLACDRETQQKFEVMFSKLKTLCDKQAPGH